ncbi:MAG: hypothetical protein AUG04_06005 [Deltaproteobacteria bacterium 13_1_20CM_2_69_21]|nr:MAG: hypothetical protein AUG04_06005 [Deltaproteobacteria bacterium 13_1_20CM_2_69_21]
MPVRAAESGVRSSWARKARCSFACRCSTASCSRTYAAIEAAMLANKQLSSAISSAGGGEYPCSSATFRIAFRKSAYSRTTSWGAKPICSRVWPCVAATCCVAGKGSPVEAASREAASSSR